MYFFFTKHKPSVCRQREDKDKTSLCELASLANWLITLASFSVCLIVWTLWFWFCCSMFCGVLRLFLPFDTCLYNWAVTPVWVNLNKSQLKILQSGFCCFYTDIKRLVNTCIMFCLRMHLVYEAGGRSTI